MVWHVYVTRLVTFPDFFLPQDKGDTNSNVNQLLENVTRGYFAPLIWFTIYFLQVNTLPT